MSYQVLARKWRPQSFKQMVGQEHVLKALINALDQQRLHHAYLFTGTRGVGKTTIGRILAKCLNCETGITSVPCGQCDTCREITEGRFVDLIEIDAASRTKVEDMRELLDNVQYAPTRGRFKVYLIDEVHMLSQSSFNALLKTLEEPPEHVKFLFATTDPQKLPVTILSRCLQFNLKNMPPERIVEHLKNILGQENIGFEESALWLLARAADGSMRDALSLTDQAIAYGNNRLAEREVSSMLGSIDQKQVYRIVEAVANQDARKVLVEVASLAEYSPDYSAVLANIISVLHRVAIEQTVPGSTDNSMGDKQQVVSLAGALSAEDVQLFYQIGLLGRSDLPISPDQRAGLEMVLLRMLAFQPNVEKNTPKLALASQSDDVGSPETAADDLHDQNINDAEKAEQSNSSDLVSPEASASDSQAVVPTPEDAVTDSVKFSANESINVKDQVIAPQTNQHTQEEVPVQATSFVDNAPITQAVANVEQHSSHEVTDNRSSNALAGHPAFEGSDPNEFAYDESYVQAQTSDMGFEPEYEHPTDVTAAQKKTVESIDEVQLSTPPLIPAEQGRSETGESESVGEVVEPATISHSSEMAVASTDNIVENDPLMQSPIESEGAGDPANQGVQEEVVNPIDIASCLQMENPLPLILPQLELTGMTQNLAANTGLKLGEMAATLTVDEGHFRLLTDVHKSRIVEAFKKKFGEQFHLEFAMGKPEAETPAEWKERKRQERLRKAVGSIEGDPNVVSLVNRFDATILLSTVEPID